MVEFEPTPHTPNDDALFNMYYIHNNYFIKKVPKWN